MKKLTLFLVAMTMSLLSFAAQPKRIYAYDLSSALVDKVYTFSFTANETPTSGKIIFYDATSGELVGEIALTNPVLGKNEVEIAEYSLPGNDGQQLNWSVELSAAAVTAYEKIFADASHRYRRGYSNVDVSPESDHFGHVYVADRTSTKSLSKFYVYNPVYAISDANGHTLGANTWAFGRFTIAPDGTVWLTDYSDGHSGLFLVDPDNLATATQFFAGTPASSGLFKNGSVEVGSSLSCASLYGKGADTKLVTVAEDYTGTSFPVAVFNVGQSDGTLATTWTTAPNILFNTLGNAAQIFDIKACEQGVWVATNRGTGSNNSGATSLRFYTWEGNCTWSSHEHTDLINGSLGGSLAITPDEKQIIMKIQDNTIAIFDVTWSGNTPTLTLNASFNCGYAAVSAINLDYAGNIVTIAGTAFSGTDTKRMSLVVYSNPTTNNTCEVPAKKTDVVTKVEAAVTLYTITTNVNDPTMGSVSGNLGTYEDGAPAELTAVANEHYEFVNWTGDVTSTDNPLIITVNGDKNITANFAKKQYTLTVFVNDENKGTIDVATGSYEYGTEVTLTATPKPDYKLLAWSNKATTPSITLTMDNNKAVSAYFVKEYATDPTFTIEKVWENTNVPAATANGFQGVGWDQKIYIKDRGNNQILSLDATESFTYATLETSSDDQPIAVDDAGNLIVRSGSTLFYNAPTQVRIFRKGETTSKVIDFVLPATGRCDFITASGDIFSEKGGYVYFFCQTQTTVSRLFIKNGEYVGVDVVGTIGTAAASQSNVVLDIYGNIHTQSKNAGAFEYNITTLSSTADPYLGAVNKQTPNSTIGGCTFELGGKEFWAYVAGTTNFSSEWQLINATDGKLVSEEVLFAKDKTSKNSVANWLNVQVVDEKTAYIYQFCPTVAAAVWKVTMKENYLVSATATNGTVSGVGTYQEGTTATLTATPNTGYKFVNWTKGGEVVSTDATYSFTVSEDVALVANFEALPKTPRAWAYNLKRGEEGDNYTFTFTATAAGQATILFEDVEGNPIAPTYHEVGAIEAGEKTVVIAKSAFEGAKDVYWSVKMDGAPIEGVVEITDASKGIYNFYLPQGVVVDNNPESKTFGTIFVAESTDGASDGGSDRAKAQKRGIFVYDQTLAELNPTSNVGILPSNVTLENTTRNALKRIAINPKTNEVAFAYNATPAAVWAVSTENVAGEATNMLDGLRFEYCNSLCFGEDGTLYVFDSGAGYPAKGSLYKIVAGEAIAIFSEHAKYGNADNSLVADGHGGLWISQNRGQLDGFNQLAHVNANGEIDFEVNSATPNGFESLSTARGALAYNPREDILAIGIGTSSAIGVSLYHVEYHIETGVPTLEFIGSVPALGKNVEGIAFDYAGDLYAVSANAERMYKFALPSKDNICTVPAPESEAIKKEVRYTVTVNIVGNGSVEGDGDYVVNTVANLIATPTVHNRFVDWKNGDLVVSTDKEYSITVTDNITLTATFEQIPQYTITTSVNDSKMGTVTEGGTYYEGTKVTLTAKANGGYVFVNWSDGNIEETRTIEVTSDLNLTANFKVATPRAWAYALNMVEDGEDYKFSFTATSAGNATIIFTDEDGNTIAPTQAVVGAVTAGENKTVNIAKTQFTGTKDIYWSVKVDGAPIEKMAEITDPSLGIYDIVAPQGIAIDNNTDSEYFGQVYVAAATDGEVSRGTQTRGIFVYNPILNELNTPNTGYLPANATLTNTTRQAIHRVAVNPTNSQVAFAYNISGSTAVWSMNPENLAGDAVNLIDGAGITKANSICFDENGILYVMDNANTGTGGKIYKIQNGVGDVFADAQAGNLWAVEDNAMTSDGRGGLWIAQNRWSVDGYPVLSHVNSNGQVDFAVSQNSSAELQALFPYDDNNASYRGQCAYYVAEDILAFAGNKEAVLFKITYDANDVPTNLEKLMSTGKLGTNIDGVAFDYAGDLYVASETTKRFYKFVVPTNNNTCTVPAPASQVIKKEQRYTVTVSVNDEAMGTATGGGEYKAGKTIMLTATANAGYRFVNWTYNNTTSTDNPLSLTVEGDISVTANFEEKPLEMVGVVKRAVQIGESVVVLTHETDGTPHLYKVVDGELAAEISQEGVIARDPDNAGDYLAISDIALTEDGKLVATNKIVCQSEDGQVAAGYKRGELRAYIWNDLAGAPSLWFTSKQSSNWYRSIQGHTIAYKGTSTNGTLFATGVTASGVKFRYSVYNVIDGVHTDPSSNNSDYYHFTKGSAQTTDALGANYQLVASPLASPNWILDGELVDPFEIVDPLTFNTEVTANAPLAADLGKKYNGASVVTVGEQHLMVAPYADEDNVAGVTVLDITNGLDYAEEMDYAELTTPLAATAAATAVKVNGDDLTITLVVDNEIHVFTIDLNLQYTRTVTNGNYGTICLPYGSSSYNGAEFYEIAYLELQADGVTPKGIWLDEVTVALEAGKPYIFKATSNLLTVNYKGEEALSPVVGKAGLTGTFDGITDETVLQGNYMIAENKFWLCGTGCWLNANRAYIDKNTLHNNTTPVAAIPGRRRVMMGAAGENTTTGVNNLTEGGAIAPNVEGTYDVLGRKFTEPNGTGFYIVNGKKVVIVK